MTIHHHSQLNFSKYYLIFLLLFFGNLAAAAGYHIVTNIGGYELSGSVDAAVLAQADSAYAGCTVLCSDAAEKDGVEALLVRYDTGEQAVVVLERFGYFQKYHVTYIPDPTVPAGAASLTLGCYWSDQQTDGPRTVQLQLTQFGSLQSIHIQQVQGSFHHGKITLVPGIIFLVLVILEVVAYILISKIRQ